MTLIGRDQWAPWRRFAVACLLFDVAVLSLLLGVGLERRNDRPPMAELARLQAELAEWKP